MGKRVSSPIFKIHQAPAKWEKVGKSGKKWENRCHHVFSKFIRHSQNSSTPARFDESCRGLMNNLVLGPPGDHLITENRDSSGPIWVPSASHQATKTHEKLPVFTTKRNSSAPGLQRRASHHLTKCYPTWGRRPNQGGGSSCVAFLPLCGHLCAGHILRNVGSVGVFTCFIPPACCHPPTSPTQHNKHPDKLG